MRSFVGPWIPSQYSMVSFFEWGSKILPTKERRGGREWLCAAWGEMRPKITNQVHKLLVRFPHFLLFHGENKKVLEQQVAHNEGGLWRGSSLFFVFGVVYIWIVVTKITNKLTGVMNGVDKYYQQCWCIFDTNLAPGVTIVYILFTLNLVDSNALLFLQYQKPAL